MSSRQFYNVRQVAEHVGVAVSTVHKAAASGALTGSRVGSRWVFNDQQITAWVRSCRYDVRGVRRLRSTDAERRPA